MKSVDPFEQIPGDTVDVTSTVWIQPQTSPNTCPGCGRCLYCGQPYTQPYPSYGPTWYGSGTYTLPQITYTSQTGDQSSWTVM